MVFIREKTFVLIFVFDILHFSGTAGLLCVVLCECAYACPLQLCTAPHQFMMAFIILSFGNINIRMGSFSQWFWIRARGGTVVPSMQMRSCGDRILIKVVDDVRAVSVVALCVSVPAPDKY